MLFVKDSPSEVAVRRLKVCRLFAGMDESKLSEVARQCTLFMSSRAWPRALVWDALNNLNQRVL